MRKLCFFIGVWGVCEFGELHALQVYPMVDQQKTAVSISRDEQNRIAVAGDRIQQVFGAEEMEIQTDEESGQIFVRLPGRASQKPLTLTLVTESGLTHDLKLRPRNIECQSILLKPKILAQVPPVRSLSHVRHLSDLFIAMMRNQPLGGYLRTAAKKTARYYPGLKIIPRLTYRSGKKIGQVYCLKNEKKTAQILEEKAFAEKGDVAIALSSLRLEPGQETHLFVISNVGSKS